MVLIQAILLTSRRVLSIIQGHSLILRKEYIMPTRKCYIKVVQDTIDVNGTKQPIYYGYRQVEDKDTHTLIDVVTPSVDKDGKPIMKAKSFKIKITELLKTRRPDFLSRKFPCVLLVSLDETLMNPNGTLLIDDKGQPVKMSFFTLDKKRDENGKRTPRLDKNGNIHLLLVVNDYIDIKDIEYTDYSFDDVDNF